MRQSQTVKPHAAASAGTQRHLWPSARRFAGWAAGLLRALPASVRRWRDRRVGLGILALGLLGGAAGCRHPHAEFYPIGIYSVRQTNDLAVVRAAGFNVVTGPASQAYLDAAQRHGLKVFAPPGTSAGPKFNAAAARAAVRAFDRHPALWAWYVVDEPDLHWIPPESVRLANSVLKRAGARKPTALVLFQGGSALHYARLTDVLMIDRYPIPWLPLANFGQHVRQARLAAGRDQPLVAIIQAFDWDYFRDLLAAPVKMRPPTYAELRCMTYLALVLRANGLFYYAFDSRGWKMREQPETWAALQSVVREVNERLPLFQAEHVWWPAQHVFASWAEQWNAALDSSIALARVRVRRGTAAIPPGDYVVAVNTTPDFHLYRFTSPAPDAAVIPVVGEDRCVEVLDGWLIDGFGPYEARVYGPVPAGG